MRLLISIALVLLSFLASAAEAQDQQRFALLIGNQKYVRAVGELENPHKDIGVVGSALGQIGFKDTQSRRDVSRDEMLFAVHELARKLRRAGKGAIGFLYYTGHGVSVSGENVLVPVNAQRTTDEELSVRGVRLAELLDILKREAPDAVMFVVLDACRNNIGGSRGAKGFAPVNDQRTGVVIAFATQAGATASDEGATSGPYAAALADEIVKPGLTDQAVFNAVRTRVATTTKGAQVPWTHDGLVGERVVFVSGAAVPTQPAMPPMSDSAPKEKLDTIAISPVAAELKRAIDTGTSAAVDAFLAKYPRTAEAGEAAIALRDFQRFEIAARLNTERAYLDYLGDPPSGLRKEEAERRIVALRQAEEERICRGTAKEALTARSGVEKLGCVPRGDHWLGTENLQFSICMRGSPEARAADALRRKDDVTTCDLTVKENAAWRSASQANTPDALRRFMADFPKSQRLAEARQRFNAFAKAAFDAAVKTNGRDGWWDFLQRFSDSDLVGEAKQRYEQVTKAQNARDDDAFKKAFDVDRSQDYDAYLAQFCRPPTKPATGKAPSEPCRHEKAARDRLIGLKQFEQIKGKGNRQQLDTFLRQFGQSRFAAVVRSEIAAIEEANLQRTCDAYVKAALDALAAYAEEQKQASIPCASVEGERWSGNAANHLSYCRQASEAQRRAEAHARRDAIEVCSRPRRDQQAWRSAEDRNSIDSFAAYRARWPEGQSFAQATTRLSELCERQWGKSAASGKWNEIEVYATGACRDFKRQAEASKRMKSIDDREWGRANGSKSRAGYAAYISATGGSVENQRAKSGEGSLRRDSAVREKGTGARADVASEAIDEFDACAAARTSQDVEAIEEFLEDSPKSRCAGEIKARLTKLQAAARVRGRD